MKPPLLWATWGAVTAGATLLAWATVGQVTADVGPTAPLPLPDEIVLATGPPDEPPPARDEGPAPRLPADPRPTESPAPAPTSKTYRLVGGVVTVVYAGDAAELVSATPSSGFVTDVNEGGPPRVDVRFESDHHKSRLIAELRDGRPDVKSEEDSED